MYKYDKISILDEHWSRKFLKNSRTEFRLNFFHWEVCKGRFFLQTNYSFKNRWGVLPNVYAILLPIKYILCVLLRNDLGSDITKLNHDGHSHGFCLWKWWHHYLFWQGEWREISSTYSLLWQVMWQLLPHTCHIRILALSFHF